MNTLLKLNGNTLNAKIKNVHTYKHIFSLLMSHKEAQCVVGIYSELFKSVFMI